MFGRRQCLRLWYNDDYWKTEKEQNYFDSRLFALVVAWLIIFKNTTSSLRSSYRRIQSAISLWIEDISWTNIRRSIYVLDVFWASFVRSLYILCPREQQVFTGSLYCSKCFSSFWVSELKGKYRKGLNVCQYCT